MAKNFNRILVKLIRVSGWLLLAVVLVYVASGYSICQRFGVNQWFDWKLAYVLHKNMDWPLGILLAAHVMPRVYLMIRR